MSYVERRRFLWVLFLAGIALAAVVANATTLARFSFDDLAQKSSAIARLRCQGSESHWDGGELWTDTRFEVVERNKGLLGASITVRMLGGRADGITSRVDGVPAFVWDKRESFCSAATNGGNGSKFAMECTAARDEEPAIKARREKR